MTREPVPRQEEPRWPDAPKRKKIDPLIVIGGALEGPDPVLLPPLNIIEEEESDPNP